MIDAFHAEIQLLGTYCHENLIPLLGFCMDKIPCLVYPLIVGGNLDDRLSLSDEARRRLQALDCTAHYVALTWRERLYILRGVCRALMYLHTASGTKGVVLHRDVKPLNILLDEQIIPKLSDVGLAKQSQELRDGARTHLSTSVIAGTRGFIDPLFITSGQYSQMTDAYAFGVTILVCLTGMPAPQAMELEMLEHVSFAPRSVDTSAHWPDNVAIAMAELVKGLSWQRTKNDRMLLETAFLRLEELAEEHVRFDVADEVQNGCVVCRSKPRSVRFVCGHCNCCRDCAAALVERGDPCPTCRAPIHVIARGAHLAGEPTYVGRVEEPVE
jgi:serine/threonine protein kinase